MDAEAITSVLPTVVPPDAPPTIKDIKTVVDKIATTDKSPEACCEEAGLTLPVIYSTLAELIKAETFAKDRYGEAVCLGPDNRTRLAAVTLALELRKHIKDKSAATNVAIINDPRINEDIDRLVTLRRQVLDA